MYLISISLPPQKISEATIVSIYSKPSVPGIGSYRLTVLGSLFCFFSFIPNSRFHGITGHSYEPTFPHIRNSKPSFHTNQIAKDHHIKPFCSVKSLLI